jgi:transposase, IS5 family
MYRKRNKEQLTIADFSIPFSGELSAENRWIKLASLIPWNELEDQYVKQFNQGGMGSPAKQYRMALGALIIKEKFCISDEETVEQMKENPNLQYFMNKPGKGNRWRP